jgi:hypothetical protein
VLAIAAMGAGVACRQNSNPPATIYPLRIVTHRFGAHPLLTATHWPRTRCVTGMTGKRGRDMTIFDMNPDRVS